MVMGYHKHYNYYKIQNLQMSIGSSMTNRRSFKVVLLGNSGVGKTSIIEQFINNKFDLHENPTIGIDFLGKTIVHKGMQCRMQLWDSAGQQKYKSLIPSYLQDADCVLFVFDVNKQQTLKDIQKWIYLYKDSNTKKSISLICGNKVDLQKNINKVKLTEVMQKHKMPYHALSAKTGQNISQLFHLVIDMILINSKKDENFNMKRIQDNCRQEFNQPQTEERFVKKTESLVRISEQKQKTKTRCLCLY